VPRARSFSAPSLLPRLLATGALACAAPAFAADSVDILSPDTLSVTGTISLAATDGEESWVDGGFGKFSTSGDADENVRILPMLGEANLVWQPRFSWALSGTVVGTFQGGERNEAGLSEAYLSYKPMRGQKTRVSARAGLMWPPVSLEHDGADWHVRDTITPSAINSWIGEEVRPVALEGTVGTSIGEHQLSATAALFAANDTSGTLLTFRGWALHNRRTLAFNRQPLPPFEQEDEGYQAPFTHPLLDVSEGFADRPGYYAKIAWQPPVPVRFELFRYDNRADPEAVNADVEWGWRTQFNNLGIAAEFAGMQVKAQAMTGRTRMGYAEPPLGRRWIDMRFRSAFLLVSRAVGKFGIAGRIEAFETRHRGSWWDEEYDEDGWAATLAGKRQWGPFTGLVELVHVSSDNPAREHIHIEPRQTQTRLQADLRLGW
jgi:hypothetical protein